MSFWTCCRFLGARIENAPSFSCQYWVRCTLILGSRVQLGIGEMISKAMELQKKSEGSQFVTWHHLHHRDLWDSKIRHSRRYHANQWLGRSGQAWGWYLHPGMTWGIIQFIWLHCHVVLTDNCCIAHTDWWHSWVRFCRFELVETVPRDLLCGEGMYSAH